MFFDVSMDLLFHVRPDRVTVMLEEGGVVVASVDLVDTRSLSQTLLPVVDGLLGNRSTKPEELGDIRVVSEVLPGFTSHRIVETTARILLSLIHI